MREYFKITNKEGIVESAQETINKLCDYTRKIITENWNEQCDDYIVQSFIGRIDIGEYILLANMLVLVKC